MLFLYIIWAVITATIAVGAAYILCIDEVWKLSMTLAIFIDACVLVLSTWGTIKLIVAAKDELIYW